MTLFKHLNPIPKSKNKPKSSHSLKKNAIEQNLWNIEEEQKRFHSEQLTFGEETKTFHNR